MRLQDMQQQGVEIIKNESEKQRNLRQKRYATARSKKYEIRR